MNKQNGKLVQEHVITNDQRELIKRKLFIVSNNGIINTTAGNIWVHNNSKYTKPFPLNLYLLMAYPLISESTITIKVVVIDTKKLFKK